MANDPVIPWSPAPTTPGPFLAPVNQPPSPVSPATPRLYSPFARQSTGQMQTPTRIQIPQTKRTGSKKLIKAKKLTKEDLKKGNYTTEDIKRATGDGFGWEDLVLGSSDVMSRENEELSRLIANAIPGMATFLGGLTADLKGVVYNKLIKNEDYDPNTAQELWHSIGRTAGLVYDAKPDRGWFARWEDYYNSAKNEQPISSLLVEDAGNIALGGAALAKGAGVAGRAARIGAESRAFAAGAGPVGAAETGFVSEAAKAAAPRLSAFAEKAMKTEAGIKKAVRPIDWVLGLPLKPYVYAAGKLGSLVRNGAYFGSLHMGFGAKAAEAYRNQLRDIESAPDFDPQNPPYEAIRLRKKIDTHTKMSMGWKARRVVVAAAREAEAEAGKQSRAVTTAVQNAEHAGKTDSVTGEVYTKELNKTEGAAVIAILNGTADLIDAMVNQFGETPESVAVLSRYDLRPDFSLTPEAAAMAVKFLKGELSPMQYDRLAAAVDAVKGALRVQAAEKAMGKGRRYPLQPHNFVPVPVVDYMLESIKKQIKKSRNAKEISHLIQIVQFIENNKALWDLPVDNPVRIQMLRYLVESLPSDIVFDSSIYPSAMRPLVEMYKRYRRNLERRAIAAGEGGDFPTGPGSGEPGAAAKYVAKARMKAEEARERVNKLSERIAKLEEQHSRSLDTLRQMEMVERVARGESIESIAAEYGMRPDDLRKIYVSTKVGRTRMRYNEARDIARKLLQQAIDAGVIKIENGIMTIVSRNELTDALQRAVEEARAINAEYSDLITRLTQEKVALAEEMENIVDEIDDTSEEMFDAEDDFVADGGDIMELEQPDTSIDELGGGDLTIEELNTRLAELAAEREQVAGELAKPAETARPAAPTGGMTKDEYLAALQELIKTGQISSTQIKQIEQAFDTTYTPQTAKKRQSSADRRAFKASKSGRYLMVGDIDGELWWTDGYIAARVADSPLLAKHIKEPGRYEPVSQKIADAKVSGFRKVMDEVPNIKSIVDQAKENSKSEARIVGANRLSKDAKVVVLELEDGTRMGIDMEIIDAVYEPGVTILASEANRAVLFVSDRGNVAVGLAMPIRDSGVIPDEASVIAATQEMGQVPTIPGATAGKEAPKTPVDTARRGELQGRLKQIDADIKEATTQLKKVEEVRQQQPAAQPRLTTPDRGVEPTGYTIDAEALFDPYDGWELYYTQEDLSIPIDEFSSLVNEKRFALAIYGDLRSVELAISDPEQYGISVDQSLINDILRGRKKDSALKSIREDINNAIATIAELESAIRDAIEPYEAARGRGRLAPVTPENVPVARPTNLRSVPVKQLPAAHAEIANPSPEFTVEVLEPHRYQGGTTTGGIEFVTSYDSVSNRFGYELFDESTFESAVKALDVIINQTQKYIDRGDYIPQLAMGLFDTTTGNKFYAKLSLDGSTPDGLDAVYAILDEAKRQRDILIGETAKRPTRPKEVKPRSYLADDDIRRQVYADDMVRSISPELSAKVDQAQTLSEKLKALDDFLKAVQRSQKKWAEHQNALDAYDRRRQSLLAIPARISSAEAAREQALDVVNQHLARAATVESSPEYQQLLEMPKTLPLDTALDPSRQNLVSIEFDNIELPDGSVVRPIGPIYVPSQADSSSMGLPGNYINREGLPGFREDISERQRTGSREMVWSLQAVAKRIYDTAERMSLNDAWGLLVAEHGLTLVEVQALINKRIDAANAADGGNRPYVDFDQMRADAQQKAANLPDEVLQAAFEPETPIDGEFVPGVGARAPGVASPEANVARMADKLFGKAVFEILKQEGIIPVDPWNRIGTNIYDYQIVDPTIMFMDKIRADLSRSLTGGLNPERPIPGLDQLTKVNKFFKSTTLVLSTMWQIGDLTTSLIIAQLTGVNVKTMIRRMKEVYEAEYGSVASMFDIDSPDIPKTQKAQLAMSSGVQDVSASMSERQFLRGFRVGERGRLLERGIIGRLGGRRLQRLADRSFKFNETINRIARHAFFLEKLDNILQAKGTTLDNVVDDGSWRYDPEIRKAIVEAAQSANKWLGDFADLSFVEKRIVSLAFPFWAWTKHIHKVFFALGMEHPESLKWYIYMGTLGSNLEEDPLDLRLGTVPVFGGASSVNFLNPLADVVEGPFARLLRGDAAGIGRSAGPAPRMIGALAGLDISRMQRLSRPAGTGIYGKTGMPTPGLVNVSDLGTTLPQAAGYLLQQFPLATRLAAFGPVGETLPGTTLALGPVSRYSTGEARRRASGEIITQPGGRLASLGRLFSIPFVPSRSDEQINDVLKSAERRLKSLERAKKKAELGG